MGPFLDPIPDHGSAGVGPQITRNGFMTKWHVSILTPPLLGPHLIPRYPLFIRLIGDMGSNGVSHMVPLWAHYGPILTHYVPERGLKWGPFWAISGVPRIRNPEIPDSGPPDLWIAGSRSLDPSASHRADAVSRYVHTMVSISPHTSWL